MAKKFKIDDTFLSSLISKSLDEEELRSGEHNDDLKKFDEFFAKMFNSKDKKLNSLVEDFSEAKETVIDKPEYARTRRVLFEKTNNNTIQNLDDLMADLNDSISETLNASFTTLIALHCYEGMVKNAEDVAKNLFINSSNPVLPDVS